MNIVPIRNEHLINANPSAELIEPWIAVTEPSFFSFGGNKSAQ